MSRWERPTAQIAEAIANRVKAEAAAVEEAVERRKERQAEMIRQKAEEDAVADRVRHEVKSTVDRWAHGKSVGGLMKDLPAIVPWLAEDVRGIIAAHLSSPTPSPGDLKKAYHKVARLLHPDSQRAKTKDLNVSQRLTHEHVFAVIAQKMQTQG